jgi:hypothetical protein
MQWECGVEVEEVRRKRRGEESEEGEREDEIGTKAQDEVEDEEESALGAAS